MKNRKAGKKSMDVFQPQHDIKLIALDMDGTLLNSKHEVSPGNRQAIKEAMEKGIHVVLSTGRPLSNCRDYATSLELSSYLITVNGSEIWGENGELVERHVIDPDIIEWLQHLAQTHDTMFWAVSSVGYWRSSVPNDVHQYSWLKFGFNTEDDEKRAKIWQQLMNNKRLEVSNSSPTNIEVNAKGVNKAQAIRNICRRLGISMEEVMTAGDSLNDLAMITEAGCGIAMGNAQETVKKAANWVTATNDEDGVALAIKKFALK